MFWFALAVIGIAIVAKWLGAGLGAYVGGLSLREAVQLGAGMISRGEVGLIMASVGAPYQLVTEEEFAVVVIMVLITTLITPVLLRSLFSAHSKPSTAAVPHESREDA
jgi:Kef-type K+ transport systems, membrane components